MSEQEQSIDLRVLLKVLTEHLIPIIAVTVVAAAVGFVLAAFVVPKRYASSALMYVENTSSKQDDSAINVNDISAAQKLVNTCQILFTSDQLLRELSTSLGESYSAAELKDMVNIEAVNSTEVLRVTVTTGSPDASLEISEKLLELTQKEFRRVIKNGSIETVSVPTKAKTHNYPSAMRFTLIGALIGLVGTYGVFLVKELLDIKVKPDDDLTQLYDIPVFAEILDFETAGKSGYKYYKYKKYGNYGGYGSYEDVDRKTSSGDMYDDSDDEDADDETEDRNSRKVENG